MSGPEAMSGTVSVPGITGEISLSVVATAEEASRIGISSTTLTTSASATSSTYSCAGAVVKESSTVESLTWVNGATGAATMGSAVIGDTGIACSWTCEVAEVGAEIGALTSASVDWGVVGVAGGAHGLSETMELAENLTLGEVGVETGNCCVGAGACCGTAFLAHSSIRVR